MPHRKTFSKHASIISGFYHEFIATGILPKQLHGNFHDAFDNRNMGDYAFMDSFLEEDAKKLLQNAEAFLASVEKLINTPII